VVSRTSTSALDSLPTVVSLAVVFLLIVVAVVAFLGGREASGVGRAPRPSPNVECVVVDEAGRACEHAQVDVEWHGLLGASEGMHLVADAAGRFSFYGVPGRTYRLRVAKVGPERLPELAATVVQHSGVEVVAPAKSAVLVVQRP